MSHIDNKIFDSVFSLSLCRCSAVDFRKFELLSSVHIREAEERISKKPSSQVFSDGQKKAKTIPFIKKTHPSPEQKTVVTVEQKNIWFL
jgi:hypothetical protein